MAQKPGIQIKIPGFGDRHIRALVSDYTGTLSCSGTLISGVGERLVRLMNLLDIHVVTADSFGTAEEQLAGILKPHKLGEGAQDVAKEQYVTQLDPKHVAALGNGNNDRLMLQAVKRAGGLAVAVDNGEGCAFDALQSCDLFIVGAINALDLLLHATRVKATLRF